MVRDTITECTGDGGMDREDSRDWCLGWRPKTWDNCTKAVEYEYTTSSNISSASYSAGVSNIKFFLLD